MQHITQLPLMGQATEKAPGYIALGLVIACGFLLARLLWAFLPADGAGILNSADEGEITAGQPNKTLDIGQEIAQSHLFGQYQKPAGSRPAAPPPSLPPLSIKLQGVYAAGGQSMAIIEVDGKQSAFSVGETIGSSGAVLEKVAAEQITVRRGDSTETVKLPTPDKSSGGAGVPDLTDDMNFAPPPEDVSMPELPSPEEYMQPLENPADNAPSPDPASEAAPADEPPPPEVIAPDSQTSLEMPQIAPDGSLIERPSVAQKLQDEESDEQQITNQE